MTGDLLTSRRGPVEKAICTAPPRLSYRISEFTEITGICRTQVYEEIAAGRLRVVKLGRCTLVLAEDAQAFLNGLRRDEA